ncbi:hypothetical protein JNUCC64_08870 [Streptomyces sp. JNUCC 64]
MKSLRGTLSAAGVAAALVTAAALTAPAAQAAPAPVAPPRASAWVPIATHTSYTHCVSIGTYLVSIWLLTDFRCDTYPPYTLWAPK